MTRPKSETREWRHAWTTAREIEWIESLWPRWVEAVGIVIARQKMGTLIKAAAARQWPVGVDGQAVLSLMRTLVI